MPLFAPLAVVLLAGCSSGTDVSSPVGTPTGAATAVSTSVTPATTAAATLPATSVTPAATAIAGYRNTALGFELVLPPALSDSRAAVCNPRDSGGTSVALGTNISVRVTDAAGASASAAAASFLSNLGASADSTADIRLAGVSGVRVEYRLQPGGRFGIGTFVVRGERLYTLVFEARDLAQCGGLATPALYDAVAGGFRFLP